MRIRAEREQEFKESMLGYRLKKDRAVNFLDYFQAYINSYTKKDIRMVQIALSRFKDFLKEQYPMNEFSIKPELITKEMMEQFVAYFNPEVWVKVLKAFTSVSRKLFDMRLTMM